MKTDILFSLGPPLWCYARDREAVIAKSGKMIKLHGWESRVKSYVWGAPLPELTKEAEALNKAQKALDERRKALNKRILETQPALIAAAKAAPKNIPPPPFVLSGKLRV